MNPFEALPRVLLPWYEANHRVLPWRADRQPYHVWLSEIMLQQTRVEAVKGYYIRFLTVCPTVTALAECDDETLHKLWEGLGYYSRVRNLRKAAIRIVEQFSGVFPTDYESIRALPGIGDYTAGAICSICFDQPTPAVDGNVLRVAARLTGHSEPVDTPAFKERLRQQLAEVYPAEAGAFTQSLMELGATVCVPNGSPKCGSCPCRDFCTARLQGNPERLPVRAPRKAKRLEEKTLFLFSCGDRYALEKRPDKGLLAGLWQFPNTAGTLDAADAVKAAEGMGLRPVNVLRQLQKDHIFTHIRWQMRCFCMEVREPEGGFVWMTPEEIHDTAALPTAFRQFWEEIYHV